MLSVLWWKLTNANYNNQLQWTAKDAKYVTFTKTKQKICHHLHLQDRYTACTKPIARNPPPSQNKNKSNTKTKHHHCITIVGKILKKWKFLRNWPTVIQQYPCYLERSRNIPKLTPAATVKVRCFAAFAHNLTTHSH